MLMHPENVSVTNCSIIILPIFELLTKPGNFFYFNTRTVHILLFCTMMTSEYTITTYASTTVAPTYRLYIRPPHRQAS